MSTESTRPDDEGAIELTGLDESFREEKIAHDETYRCEVCHYTSQYKSNLTRHLKVHYEETTEAPTATPSLHMCEVCGKQLKTKYGLKQHTDSTHKLKFRFTCGSCKKDFNSLYNYKGHLASHYKVLKEKCKSCPATFQYKSGLADHVKAQHDGSTYPCEENGCEETFASARALREHKLVVHQNKRFSCSNCNKTFKWRSSKAFHEQNAHSH